jgi:peptidoglycan/LPS O-acetylase OafA/YrhL
MPVGRRWLTRDAPTINQAGENRQAPVESLRALAALAVLEGHVFGVSRGYGAGAYATYLDRLLLGGGFGVYLFFALTGYLLYRPFARRDFASGSNVRLGRYAANRALRILPLYYAVLVVYILAIDHGGSVTTWWRSLLLLENFFPATLAHVDGVMWSLVVEVQFYILLPFIAFAIMKVASSSWQRACWCLVGVGLAAELVRWITVSSVTGPSERWTYSLPSTFVFFVPGMLLAVLQTAWHDEGPQALLGWAGRSSSWLLASLPFWAIVVWHYDLDFLLVPATFLTVGAVALPLRRGLVGKVLEWRPLALIGIASYSLYLWHFPIVNQIAQRAPSLGYWELLVICVPLSCVVALVSYRVIEAPFLRLRRSWSGSQRRPQATDPHVGLHAGAAGGEQ